MYTRWYVHVYRHAHSHIAWCTLMRTTSVYEHAVRAITYVLTLIKNGSSFTQTHTYTHIRFTRPNLTHRQTPQTRTHTHTPRYHSLLPNTFNLMRGRWAQGCRRLMIIIVENLNVFCCIVYFCVGSYWTYLITYVYNVYMYEYIYMHIRICIYISWCLTILP